MANTLKINAQSDREIVMARDFDAPRDLVYDAYTKPELLKRWLGVFRGWTMRVCEMDVRPGGSYRWVWRNPDGSQMTVRGVFREVVPNERLVATERFDDAWYPGEGLNTTTFVEKGGRTTLTQTLRYESREARDAVLKSPMETGVAASFDNLERILASGDIKEIGRAS